MPASRPVAGGAGKAKTPASRPARWERGARGLLPVLLDARRAQAGEAVLVDRVLPGEEFLDRQSITAASFLEGEQPAAHGGDHLGLAPDDPALRARCRQIRNRQRAAVRPDHVLSPRSKGL